jgi:LAO/AO transport system kinase
MSNYSVKELLDLIKKGDKRAFARAITILENKESGWNHLLNALYRNMTGTAIIIGITGPGGAGKSTLVDKIIKVYRSKGKKVGVIAVDPSSPYTGGAFLGDRVRMGAHNTDPDVFIRSFGSRGAMGGISQGTKNVLYLYKNYNFDVIIVESLGIGQDETEITNFVDVTAVTLVPGFGDAMQMAKAGMQEIADIFIVNKADKPDAEGYYQQLINSLSMMNEDCKPVVLKTVASDNVGVDELVNQITIIGNHHIVNREQKNINRIKIEIETEIYMLLHEKIKKIVEDMSRKILSNESTPFEVSKKIFDKIDINF